MRDNDFISAIKEAIERVGSEMKLAEKSGIKQPDINRIKNKKTPINNVTIGTLRKIFPDIQMDFFGTGAQRGRVSQIVKMLNRLTDQEQESIYEAIISCFPHVINNDVKNTIKKIKPIDEE